MTNEIVKQKCGHCGGPRHASLSAYITEHPDDADFPIRLRAMRPRPDEDETFDLSKTAARALIAQLDAALRELP